jgi:hypothetical protein
MNFLTNGKNFSFSRIFLFHEVKNDFYTSGWNTRRIVAVRLQCTLVTIHFWKRAKLIDSPYYIREVLGMTVLPSVTSYILRKYNDDIEGYYFYIHGRKLSPSSKHSTFIRNVGKPVSHSIASHPRTKSKSKKRN